MAHGKGANLLAYISICAALAQGLIMDTGTQFSTTIYLPVISTPGSLGGCSATELTEPGFSGLGRRDLHEFDVFGNELNTWSDYNYDNQWDTRREQGFDAVGRLLWYQYRTPPDPQAYSRTTITYDLNNRVIRERGLNGQGIVTSETRYFYSGFDVVKIINDEGDINFPRRIREYEYYDPGRARVFRDDMDADGEVDYSERYTWNDRLITRTVANYRDISPKIIEYYYDEQERLIAIEVQVEAELIAREEREYDAMGLLATTRAYQHSHLESEWHYHYDDRGRIVRETEMYLGSVSKSVLWSYECR